MRLRLLKRHHRPGQAPGSLPEPTALAEPTRMRLVRYSVDTLVEADLLSPAGLDEVAPSEACWLAMEGHDIRLVSEIGDRLGIHPLALEDVVNTGQRPKVEDYEHSLFLVVDHFTFDAEAFELHKQQVSLVLQAGVLLSVEEQSGTLFDPVRDRLRTGKPRIRQPRSDYLAYALVDTVVDHLFPVLEELGDSIEEAEESILDDPTRDDVNALHVLKRHLLVLRKSCWPLRDMLAQLLRSESPLISAETRLYLRDVADHVALAIDIIETYREMVSSLVDLYLSNLSNKMNEVMKVLTIIATIFIPLSFIAGVYGMNFERSASPWSMPELGWYWGYPAVLLLMAAVAGGLLVFFRRRGWI